MNKRKHLDKRYHYRRSPKKPRYNSHNETGDVCDNLKLTRSEKLKKGIVIPDNQRPVVTKELRLDQFPDEFLFHFMNLKPKRYFDVLAYVNKRFYKISEMWLKAKKEQIKKLIGYSGNFIPKNMFVRFDGTCDPGHKEPDKDGKTEYDEEEIKLLTGEVTCCPLPDIKKLNWTSYRISKCRYCKEWPIVDGDELYSSARTFCWKCYGIDNKSKCSGCPEDIGSSSLMCRVCKRFFCGLCSCRMVFCLRKRDDNYSDYKNVCKKCLHYKNRYKEWIDSDEIYTKSEQLKLVHDIDSGVLRYVDCFW